MIFDDQDINLEIKQEIAYLQDIVRGKQGASFERIEGGYKSILPNLHVWPRLVTRKIKYCKEMYCFDGTFSMKQLKLLSSVIKFSSNNMKIDNKRHEALTNIPPLYCNSSFSIKFFDPNTLVNTHIETGLFSVSDCTTWQDPQSATCALPSHFSAPHVILRGVERFDDLLGYIRGFIEVGVDRTIRINKKSFDQFILKSFGLPLQHTKRFSLEDCNRGVYLNCDPHDEYYMVTAQCAVFCDLTRDLY